MNSKYIRGRRAEYKVIAKLKADGYSTIRSAGSKGLWDIVAYPNQWHQNHKSQGNHWIVIQVKLNKKPILKEMKAMQKEYIPFAVKQVWIVKDRQKEIGIITIE